MFAFGDIFCHVRFNQLRVDTSSAKNFNLIKNFFTYVDDLEYLFKGIKGSMDQRVKKVLILQVDSLFTFDAKDEFKQAVEKITSLKDTDPHEIDFLFKMIDANDDGFIDAENDPIVETLLKSANSHVA